MTPIEQQFQTLGAELDHLDPLPSDWERIEAQLPPPAPRSRNKWLLLGVAVLLLSMAAFWWWPQADQSPTPVHELQVGDAFPALTLQDPHGREVSLSDLRGKVVLVEFWSAYSMVCTEAQCYYFKPIYEQYADLGFEIYGVSLDSNAQDWVDAIQTHDLPWIHVSGSGAESGAIGSELNHEELPATFLLDQNGNILARDLQSGELERELERILGLPVP